MNTIIGLQKLSMLHKRVAPSTEEQGVITIMSDKEPFGEKGER